jgi:L,D-peptidoglycan transpeptidase YkuD (ErfK/YbiS/YcfS/YnhG family)
MLAGTCEMGAAEPIEAEVRQLLVVLPADWEASTARLVRFELDAAGAWRPVDSGWPVVIGRAGCGWGLGLHPPQSEGPLKREGDGRSPAGIFTVGPAFGRDDTCETGLVYLPLDHGHWCIDVPDSPHYNQIVHEEHVGEHALEGSTEPMRRDIHLDDDLYRIGFLIGHNPANEPAAGSCIFAHLWSDSRSPTAGCVGLAEADLQQLLAWLDAAAEPRLVLLPQAEYTRLRGPWRLPNCPEPVE